MKSNGKFLSIVLVILLAAAMTACEANVSTDDGSQTVSQDTSAVSQLDSENASATEVSETDSDSSDKSDSSKKSESSKNSASSKKSDSSDKSESSKNNTSSKKSASSKTTSRKASTDDDGQNPVMNFIGTYTCDRAIMTIRCEGKTDAEITVRWSSSASTYAAWGMTGTLDTETLTVDYSDCQKTAIELDSEGLIVTEDREYTNGKGRIIFNDGGTVTWEDYEENAAAGMIFKFDPNAEENSNADDDSSDSAYLDKGEAIANVRQQAGSGAQIIDAYQGYTPEGYEAWVITVAPVSSSEDAENVTYYCNRFFCYAADSYNSEDDNQNDDEYLSREEAIANVKQQAGSGAKIIDAYKGYTPDGDEAWVITVTPVSASEDAENVTYYCNRFFCYSK